VLAECIKDNFKSIYISHIILKAAGKLPAAFY
jgi:hypothetical protein